MPGVQAGYSAHMFADWGWQKAIWSYCSTGRFSFNPCLFANLSYRYTYRPLRAPYLFQANAGLYFKDLLFESRRKGTSVLPLQGEITRRRETLFDLRVGRRFMSQVNDRREMYLLAGIAYRFGWEGKTYFVPWGTGGYEALGVGRSISSWGGLVGIECRWPIFKWLSLHPSAGSYGAELARNLRRLRASPE